jgi:hypothetical protein
MLCCRSLESLHHGDRMETGMKVYKGNRVSSLYHEFLLGLHRCIHYRKVYKEIVYTLY